MLANEKKEKKHNGSGTDRGKVPQIKMRQPALAKFERRSDINIIDVINMDRKVDP